jgi:hypothetical protein
LETPRLNGKKRGAANHHIQIDPAVTSRLASGALSGLGIFHPLESREVGGFGHFQAPDGTAGVEVERVDDGLALVDSAGRERP